MNAMGKTMKKFTARIYTKGERGPAQTLLDFETTSMARAKAYGKAIALERDGRLVNVWENTQESKGGIKC